MTGLFLCALLAAVTVDEGLGGVVAGVAPETSPVPPQLLLLLTGTRGYW